jgi:hypothetical protein
MFKENIYINSELNFRTIDNVDRLKEKAETVRNKLLNLLEEWHIMNNETLPRLNFIYETLFSVLDFELQYKTNVLAELSRRLELIFSSIGRGEKINLKALELIEEIIKNEFNSSENMNENDLNTNINKPNQKNGIKNPEQSEYYILKNHWQYDACKQIISEAKINFQLNLHIEKEYVSTLSNGDKEIPGIYRAIVKILHPDLSGETEYYKRFWNGVQYAYKNKDLVRLKLYYQTICLEEYYLTGDIKNKEIFLNKYINDIEYHIRTEARKIDDHRKKEPFSIESKLNDKNWINTRTLYFQSQLFKLNKNIFIIGNNLKKITGYDWKKFKLYSNNCDI